MKIIKLFTDSDNKSYFQEVNTGKTTEHHLGNYSEKFPVKGLNFREFNEGCFFDWHNAPQEQYIVYLEGEVEVVASGGETKIFKSGDVLFATDLAGEGHTTRTLTNGRSLILTTN